MIVMTNLEFFILSFTIGAIGSVIGMLLGQHSVWRYLRKKRRVEIGNHVYTAVYTAISRYEEVMTGSVN